MITKKLFTTIALTLVCGFSFFWLLKSSESGLGEYKPRTNQNILQEKGIAGAMDWLRARRADVNTGDLDIEMVEKSYLAYLDFSNQNQSKNLGTQWIEMGPNNFAGRTRALLIDKDNNDLMFAGGVSGGLWKSSTGGSSWFKVTSLDNMIIGSICQAANGDIYVGTGEGFTASHLSGFWGRGIYKSTDRGATWTQLPSTWNSDSQTQMTFRAIYSLAAHPTNAQKIYAATQRGLRVSNDGGATWSNPITGVDASQVSSCVKISHDASLVIAAVNNRAYVCNTNDDVFVKKSEAEGPYISSSTGRIEFAISPSNPNYVYCFAASQNGGLYNVYQSKDKGNTWAALIEVQSEYFQPFGSNNQGWYDNVIAVYPDDPERIMLGGIDLWEWKENHIGFQQLTAWYLWSLNPKYVHADIHAIVFHPNYKSPSNPNGNQTMFVGTDGGVFRSLDGGNTWKSINKNYNVTQFYSVAYSGNGRVMGGTQDNGTLYLDFLGTEIQNAKSVMGGDGGYAEMSMLNPDVLFSTLYYGQIFRSESRGLMSTMSPGEIYSANLMSAQNIGSTGEPFVTPIRLHENYYDELSNYYIPFIAVREHGLGDTIYAVSKSKNLITHYITQEDIDYAGGSIVADDTVFVKDHYSAMLAVGLNGNVWMTRQAIDFTSVPPQWYRLTPASLNVGQVGTLEFSACGNYLYFADHNRKVYRVSNLLQARDSVADVTHPNTVIETQLIGTFPQFVTGIAVDPQNANNVIVVGGNFNNQNYIWYSNNAATTTSTSMGDNFSSKQGNLPLFPVYSALINWSDSKQVIIGTEYGIFATSNILDSEPTWTEENNGIPAVPVLMLRQQIHPNGWHAQAQSPTQVYNHGHIFAATHGRGIFRCESFKGPVGIIANQQDKLKSNIKVYPNPVVDYAIISCEIEKMNSVVEVKVYDLKGALVDVVRKENVSKGTFKHTFNRNTLNAGTYIYNVTINGTNQSGKFIIL